MGTKLTPGSVSRILNGEDVSEAVVQVLRCEQVSVSEEIYAILISDGAVYSHMILGAQLNSLVVKKELEEFAVIRVDKCDGIRRVGDNKYRRLLNLTVLTPGADVGQILGDPVDYSTISSANIKITTTEPESSASTQMTQVANEHSKLVKLPQLTAGSIEMILNGSKMRSVVMQVLGFIKDPFVKDLENHRYRLLISDGVSYCNNAVLHKKLNNFIANKDLEKFTIIRIDKLVFKQELRHKNIFIIGLTILTPGAEVGEKLGNPVYVSTSAAGGTALDIPNTHERNMADTLTAGAINRILHGYDATGAVIQVLQYKKSTVFEDTYTMDISDGVIFTYSLLNQELNSMVTNKQLEEFTIIGIDECALAETSEGSKYCTLLSITVLKPGADVGGIIGDPTYASTISTVATEGSAVKTNGAVASQMTSVTSKHSKSNMATTLTPGAVFRILNGDDVSGAVIQVIDFEKIPVSKERYAMDISDGVIHALINLDKQLNSMITNKELEVFAIIRVDKYTSCQGMKGKFFRLLNTTVLTPGADVGTILESPVDSSKLSTSSTKAIEPKSTATSQMSTIASENSKLNTATALTAGAITRILYGYNVTGAIIQVLEYKRGTVVNDIYTLDISDGVIFTYALLNRQLNSMITNKQLEEFTIIRVDECNLVATTGGSKYCSLLSITPITPGTHVGGIIGDPSYAATISTITIEGTVMGTENAATSQMTDKNSKSNLATTLTAGTVYRILNGDDVSGSVIQVIDYEEISESKECYAIDISDGIIHAVIKLEEQLNSMITNRELEEFAIIRVDKCVSVQLDTGIFLKVLQVTVLTPGADVGNILEIPVDSSNVSTPSTKAIEPKSTATSQMPIVASKNPKSIMFPKLTSDSIYQIWNGCNVTGAVIQILGYRKSPCTGYDRYQLLICDGFYFCPSAILDIKLNSMIANKELEKFTIVRVDSYVYKKDSVLKMLILTSLTILTPGVDVGKKLGNVFNSFASISASNT